MKKTITHVVRLNNSYVQYYSDGSMQKFSNVVSVPQPTVEAYALDFAAQIADKGNIGSSE